MISISYVGSFFDFFDLGTYLFRRAGELPLLITIFLSMLHTFMSFIFYDLWFWFDWEICFADMDGWERDDGHHRRTLLLFLCLYLLLQQ